jgi:hypothetical protein
MNEPEHFLARWLRVKQEASSGAPTPHVEVPAAGNAFAEPPGETRGAAPAAFDPASLPPVESITQASDISPYLQSGVPAELVRAALRAVWIADPAIRDFIGLAECQWDFNDPAAMPGFGPLEVTEQAESVARLVARVVRAPDVPAGITPFAEHRADEVVPAPRQEAVPVPRQEAVPAPPQETFHADRGLESPAETERGGGLRRHGSALPKSIR